MAGREFINFYISLIIMEWQNFKINYLDIDETFDCKMSLNKTVKKLILQLFNSYRYYMHVSMKLKGRK